MLINLCHSDDMMTLWIRGNLVGMYASSHVTDAICVDLNSTTDHVSNYYLRMAQHYDGGTSP